MNTNLVHVQNTTTQWGMTMLELLIVLVLVAVLATLAGPSFTGSIARAEVDGMRNKLTSALQYGRSEALKRKAPVTICTSSDQTACSGDANWQTGWIVFSDASADATVNGDDQLLQVEYDGSYQNTSLEVYAAAGSAITFNRIGRAAAGAGDYAFCHPGQPTRGRAVRVSVTGAVERLQEALGSCP